MSPAVLLGAIKIADDFHLSSHSYCMNFNSCCCFFFLLFRQDIFCILLLYNVQKCNWRLQFQSWTLLSEPIWLEVPGNKGKVSCSRTQHCQLLVGFKLTSLYSAPLILSTKLQWFYLDIFSALYGSHSQQCSRILSRYYQTFGLVQSWILPDQIKFYRTEKNEQVEWLHIRIYQLYLCLIWWLKAIACLFLT